MSSTKTPAKKTSPQKKTVANSTRHAAKSPSAKAKPAAAKRASTTRKRATVKAKPAAAKRAPARKRTSVKAKPAAAKRVPARKSSSVKAKPAAAKRAPARKSSSVKAKPAAAKRVPAEAKSAAVSAPISKLAREQLSQELQDLLLRGSQQGSLDSEEIASVISNLDSADEERESEIFYGELHRMKIEYTGEVDEKELKEINEKEAEGSYTTDSFRQFLHQICKVPLLTHAQEKRLAREKELYVAVKKAEKEGTEPPEHTPEELEKSRRAFHHMWEANLRLVVSIAKHYHYPGGGSLPMPDLCQEGALGLERAITKFDYRRGFKLSTYATWWIRQAITRALAYQRRSIRIPVHQTEQINKFKRARTVLQMRHGRDATIAEIAKYMDKTPKEVENLQILSTDIASLNQIVGDEGEGSSELGDMIPSEDDDRPDEQTLKAVTTDVVSRALSKLSRPERQVLMMRYALGEEKERTLEEVSRKIGKTRERVRTIEEEAKKKLEQDPELAELVELMSD